MILPNSYVSLTAPITPGSGTFLQYGGGGTGPALTAAFGTLSYEEGYQVIDSVQYIIQTGAAVSAGTIGVQLLVPWGGASGTWITATTPNSATGAAFTLVATLGANLTYNGALNVAGNIFVPAIGIRLSYGGLTGGNITQGALFVTRR